MPGNTTPTHPSKNTQQFSKFIVIGCSNFLVSFAVFFLFYNYLPLSDALFNFLGATGVSLQAAIHGTGAASLDATLANIIGYSAGILNSFTWNKLWTFKAQYETVRQFKRFLLLNLACLLLSSACLFLFTDLLEWPYMPVWLITMTAITMVNFIGSKHWVFRPKEAV